MPQDLLSKVDKSILFSPRAVHLGGAHPYCVKYTVYTEEGEEVTPVTSIDQYNNLDYLESDRVEAAICFAGLRHILERRDLNRIALPYFERPSVPLPWLTYEERRDWVNLCCNSGILPEHQRDNPVFCVLELNPDMPPSLLYFQLCLWRSMYEKQGLIRGVLHLVNDVRLDFDLAYFIASHALIPYGGHNFLSMAGSYRFGYIPTISPHNLYKLHKFISNPYELDQSTLKNHSHWFDTVRSVKLSAGIKDEKKKLKEEKIHLYVKNNMLCRLEDFFNLELVEKIYNLDTLEL